MMQRQVRKRCFVRKSIECKAGNDKHEIPVMQGFRLLGALTLFNKEKLGENRILRTFADEKQSLKLLNIIKLKI